MPASDQTPGTQPQQNPHSPQQRYLLGAQLAQAGEYSRAVEQMTAAVMLDPELHTARLQLGLLHLTMGHPQQALATLAPLRQTSGALRQFADGLEALIHDDFEHCIRLLTAGIALNTSNAALNKDMGLIVDKVRALLESRQGPTSAGGGQPQPVRTDFSLYDPTSK